MSIRRKKRRTTRPQEPYDRRTEKLSPEEKAYYMSKRISELGEGDLLRTDENPVNLLLLESRGIARRVMVTNLVDSENPEAYARTDLQLSNKDVEALEITLRELMEAKNSDMIQDILDSADGNDEPKQKKAI